MGSGQRAQLGLHLPGDFLHLFAASLSMGACEGTPAPKGTGKVVIYGMSISGNVIPPVLFCLDYKCGGMEEMNIMKGEHKTPEKLALNPFHQMPIMLDGDVKLAESNAILRYLAKVYAPPTYGSDIKSQCTVDWAMDWASTNFMEQFKGIWYPVAGFAEAPKDQSAVNAVAVDNLDKFEKKFLTGGKFIGGDKLSIADYKIGTLLWYLGFPAIANKPGYKHSARMETYVKDWKVALSPESLKFLEAGEGFMASKV